MVAMVIGTRLFHVVTNGARIPVEVRLFQPQTDGRGWHCRYEIDWPDVPRASEAWGADALQAIELTLQKIGIEFYTSPWHEAGQIEWTGQGGGYGFPLPRNARDLLIGNDKTVYG
jgi:hypothetical protein